MSKKLTQEEVIARFRAVHGDKFDYSLVEYKNKRTAVLIGCPIHGIFPQQPAHHWNGHGCPKCKGEKARTVIYGVGVKDVYGKFLKAESVWRDMLRRCYTDKNKTYIDCSVCEEWHLFSNFKKWFDENYVEGYELDKDILIPYNNIYSPDTCCFVPHRINLLVSKIKYPKRVLGVTEYRGKFYAQMNMDNPRRNVQLGEFNTPEEAFQAYKTAKESYIKQVAQEYYDRGEITKKVYDALVNWKIVKDR